MKDLEHNIVFALVYKKSDKYVITMSHHISNRLFEIKDVPPFTFGNSFRVSNLFWSMLSSDSNHLREGLGWEF